MGSTAGSKNAHDAGSARFFFVYVTHMSFEQYGACECVTAAAAAVTHFSHFTSHWCNICARGGMCARTFVGQQHDLYLCVYMLEMIDNKLRAVRVVARELLIGGEK